jgi:hypothetical protein
MEKALAWIDTKVDRLAEEPFLAWIGATIAAGGMMVVALVINVSAVTFDGGLKGLPNVTGVLVPKQVGYYAALNWSLFSMILEPLIIFFALKTRAEVPRLLAALAEAGMVRDTAFHRVPAERLLAEWGVMRKHLRWVYVAIIILCVFAIGSDWVETVGTPLFNPETYRGLAITHPEQEFDWSVCTLFAKPCTPWIVELLFGIIAYTLFALLGTIFGFFVLIGGALSVCFACGLLQRTTGDGLRWRLVAIPASDEDPRNGFGVFAEIFTWITAAAIAVALGLYLMALQNAYLRAAVRPDDGNILGFLLGDVADLVKRLGLNAPDTTSTPDRILEVAYKAATHFTPLFSWLVKPLSDLYENHNIQFGMIFYALTLIVTVTASWAVLSNVAKAGQQLAQDNAGALAAELGMDEEQVEDRLNDMKRWPVGWINLNQLLVVLGAMILAFFSYRVGLLIVIYMLARLAIAIAGLVSDWLVELWRTVNPKPVRNRKRHGGRKPVRPAAAPPDPAPRDDDKAG